MWQGEDTKRGGTEEKECSSWSLLWWATEVVEKIENIETLYK